MSQVACFFGQHKNEKLIFYIYKHWLHLIEKVYKNILIFLLSFLLFYIWIHIEDVKNMSIFAFFSENFEIFMVFYIWFLIHIHLIFTQVFSYLFDLVILTDTRLIEIKESLFFQENRESIDLAKIQDIQAHKNGVLQNFLQYGHISFTFATMIDPKSIYNIPAPLHFTELIHKLKRRLIYKHEQLDEQNVELERFSGDSYSDEVVI